MPTEDIERVALSRSIDLVPCPAAYCCRGRTVGINQMTALLPELGVGPSGNETKAHGRSGQYSNFRFLCSIKARPGSGARRRSSGVPSRNIMLWRVRIRATARAVRDRMEGARDRALYYRDILLPLA